MTWTKLGDEFGDECWTLSDAAYRLHVDGLVWSNRKGTDGQLTMMHPGAGVGLKAAPSYSPLEGAAGSLLQPILLPDAFPLQYEPDRVWSHFPGAPMDSQSVSYLRHVSNLSPAAVTPEGETIPDIQMQVSQFTATAFKVNGICSFTRELIDDYESMRAFAPAELTKSVIDKETNYVINDPSAGILATPGILTRNANNSVNGIDAVEAAKDDIRVATSAFGMADLVIMHPTTWMSMRLTRATTGQYFVAAERTHGLFGSAAG